MVQITLDVEFVKLVNSLRKAQRKYFVHRGSALLAQCKQLEKQVDKYLDDILKIVEKAENDNSADSTQGSLL